MMESIKSVCGWCSIVLRDGDDSKISHDICSECCRQYFPGVKLDEVKENETTHDLR
jgi:hypothetical protein